MAYVYIVNEILRRDPNGLLKRTMDFSPALSFGQLRHVIPAGAPPDDTTVLVSQIQHGLRNFIAEDYLLLVGNPVAIGAATAIAVGMTGGYVKVLMWVARLRRYHAQELVIPKTNQGG